MQEEATQYVVKCYRCLKRKSAPQVAPIYVSQPMELVHIDYLSILLDIHWHIQVKLKQHKLQLEYLGIISFAIMDSQ